jgi:apolipoprotein N-acyltransferase
MSVWNPMKKLLHIKRMLSATVLSALFFFYSTGFYDCWLLTWLAPLPVCLYALQARTKATLVASFLASFAGAMNTWGYLPFPIFFLTITINAFAFSASILLFRNTVLSGKPANAPLLFASSYTAYEFIRTLFSSYGTFESMAYTQTLNLPILQLASITGIWGITFLLMLFPASLAVLWYNRQNRTVSLPIILFSSILFAIVILWGCVRLFIPLEGPSMKVGLVSIATTLERLQSHDRQSMTDTLDRYNQCIDRLAASGAQFVLLPEKLAFLSPETYNLSLDSLAQAAHKNNITLIAGLSKQESHLYNSAFLFSPEGKILSSYHKHHLLSPYENHYTPGTDLTLVNIGNTNSGGIAICKDMDFVQPSSDYSRQGIGILFIPALDFHRDGWLHARIAVLRGVEENVAVARAAQWGLLTISDSRGRIIGITNSDIAAGEALLLKEVTLGSGQSFYSRTGDWFAYLSLLLTCLLTITLLLKKNANCPKQAMLE